MGGSGGRNMAGVSFKKSLKKPLDTSLAPVILMGYHSGRELLT